MRRMHCLAIAALVIGGIALFRTRRGWHRHPHFAGHHHHHHGHWRGHGRRRGGWLGRLLGGLDLSPDQEKTVRKEVAYVRDRLGALREERGASRADLATALRGDSLDEALLEGMFARHDRHLAGLRVELAGALGRVHEILDPRQRERLAEILEGGRRRAR